MTAHTFWPYPAETRFRCGKIDGQTHCRSETHLLLMPKWTNTKKCPRYLIEPTKGQSQAPPVARHYYQAYPNGFYKRAQIFLDPIYGQLLELDFNFVSNAHMCEQKSPQSKSKKEILSRHWSPRTYDIIMLSSGMYRKSNYGAKAKIRGWFQGITQSSKREARIFITQNRIW